MKHNNCKPVRQGDVYLHPSTIPASARRIEPTDPRYVRDGRYVLALGEVSGHAHVIDVTPEVELWEESGVLWLRVLGETPLRHVDLASDAPTTDHATGIIAPGERKLVIQQEVQPDGIVRPVLD